MKTLPLYDVKLSDFSKRFIAALLEKRWRRSRYGQRYKKKKKDSSSSSSSDSLASEDEIGEFEPRRPSYCIHDEYFFRPVVFSWTDDKCYF